MKPFIKKLIIGAIIADTIWASLVATFALIFAAAISDGPDGGAIVFNLATILGWLLTFMAAFVRAAIFMTVVAIAVFIITLVITALKGNKKFN